MTKTRSFHTCTKLVIAVLCVSFALCMLLAGAAAFPAAYAEGTVSASGIFSTSGANLESDSENEQGYTHLTYSADDGGTVAFRRDLALKWYALGADNAGEAHYFSTELSFPEVNFTAFTLTMETTEMSMSEEGKAVNVLTFTPDEAGLSVSVNEEAVGTLAYAAGDTLSVSFTGDDTYGNFDLSVANTTQNAELTSVFTNIGKNFADYAAASAETPVTPLSFSAETEGDAVVFSVLSLNGQSFALDEENRITDDTPPVLVIDSEIKQFILGSEFDFEMVALDVCDSSIATLDREKYYYADPDAANIVFKDGVLQLGTTAEEGEDAASTQFYTEWEDDHSFFEDEFENTEQPRISVAVSLKDDSDNTGWYLVEWYGQYDADAYGIPVVTPDKAAEARPSAGFYTTDDVPSLPEANAAAIEAYQEAVTAAAVTEDEDGNKASIQVGTGAYFYLPSLKEYIADPTCGYTDMEFTIYYSVNGGSTSTNSSLSYDELSIELSAEGSYRFCVVPSNAAGRAAYGVFETYEGSGVYAFKEITSENVWDARNLASFTFSVTYSGPKVEAPEDDDSGYVDVTYTFDSFEIVALSGYQTKYALYRVELFADSGIGSVSALEQAYADGRIAMTREEAEADPSNFVGYLVEIGAYDSELEEDEGDNPYEWDPTGSLSFVPQEIGYYILTVEVASYPWSNANGTVSAQKAVYVGAESDVQQGETYWLQNNILSVVLFSVGGACLIAIIVLLLVRPKKKPAAANAEGGAEEADLKQKRKERKDK